LYPRNAIYANPPKEIVDEPEKLRHTSGLRLKKYEGSAQMKIFRVVREVDSGPKTGLRGVRALVDKATGRVGPTGASWEYLK